MHQRGRDIQPFSDLKYFWGRLLATGPVPPQKGDAGFVSAEALTTPLPYNAGASSGSNQGPLNPALEDAVKARIAALKAADPSKTAPIPVDLVTASGSGLDPHISPAAAAWQAPRVARLCGLSIESVRGLVEKHTQGRQFGVLGETRVNVLQLNLALGAERR